MEREGAAAPRAGVEQPVFRVTQQESNIPNTWGYFDGASLLKWKQFKQRFEVTIHNNRDVSPIFKFTHLKNSLKGRAAQLIAGYDVNEGNYEAAWNKLRAEYGAKYPLARAYLAQFFLLKKVSTPATKEELERLSRVTTETIQNLETEQLPVQHWDVIIVHVLHGLLNDSLSYEWNKELANQPNGMPTTANMVAFLDLRARAAISGALPPQPLSISIHNEHVSRSENRNNQANTSRNSSRASSAHGSAHGSARSSAPGTSQSGNWKYPCGACNADHKIYYCPEFTALGRNARVGVAKKKGLCVLCLKRGHNVSNCHDLSRCSQPQCRQTNDTRHNSLLCPAQRDQQVANAAQIQGAAGTAKGTKRGAEHPA